VVTALSTRAVALLTYLVLHRNSPQLRHRLSGLFWPESSEAQARTNLGQGGERDRDISR
jgi:DNA-binding SARP family transcriptional activator